MSEDWISQSIERWPLARLKAHPENAAIFGTPASTRDSLGTLLAAIEEHGIWDPLLVKADGTILAGHLRRACAEELGLADVPVRLCAPPTYLDEVTLLIRSNTDRRQLTRREIGLAFKRLMDIPRELGGAKAKRGRPGSGDVKGVRSDTFSKTRDEAAARLGVAQRTAAACEVVFTTPGVPDAVLDAVNDGRLGATTAADAIRKERRRQGGAITSPERLDALVNAKRSQEQQRVASAAEKYRESHARLLKVYRELRSVLTQLPLATVLGPTEQEEYRGALENIALCVAMELRGEGATHVKPILTVIEGGRE